MYVPQSFTNGLLFKAVCGGLCILAMTVYAQPPGHGSDNFVSRFEVASIKPNDPSSMFTMVQMKFGQEGYSAVHVTLRILIEDAYGVKDKQLLNLPTWADAARFDIEAKTDSDTTEKLTKLDGAALTEAHQRMLQALLSERFGFKMHWDKKELPVYSLLVARSGSKLHESRPGDAYEAGLKASDGNALGPHMMKFGGGQNGGEIGGQGVSIELLVQQLTAQLGQLVIDKTGMKGVYDFQLRWSADDVSTPFQDSPQREPQASTSSVMNNVAPSLFTAIQEQLGLKLDPTKGPVDVVAVEHLEQPSEN